MEVECNKFENMNLMIKIFISPSLHTCYISMVALWKSFTPFYKIEIQWNKSKHTIFFLSLNQLNIFQLFCHINWKRIFKFIFKKKRKQFILFISPSFPSNRMSIVIHFFEWQQFKHVFFFLPWMKAISEGMDKYLT